MKASPLLKTSTLLMDEYHWRELVERVGAEWSTLGKRAEECRDTVQQMLGNFFRETPVPADTMALLCDEFRTERERRRRGPEHEFRVFNFQQFFRQSQHYQTLVTQISALGWAEPGELQAKLAREWEKVFHQLEKKIAKKLEQKQHCSAHTQLVLRERRESDRPPATLSETCFGPLRHVGRLFGEDYDLFFEGHGLVKPEEEDSPKPALFDEPPIKPFREVLGQLFTEHLGVREVVEQRRNFWSAQPERLITFKYHLMREEPGPRTSWQRFLFSIGFGRAKIRRQRELREQLAWQPPMLEMAPVREEWWELMYNRRKECVREQQLLNEESAKLDDRVRQVRHELNRHEESAQELARLDDPIPVDAVLARADELVRDAHGILDGARVLYSEMNQT